MFLLITIIFIYQQFIFIHYLFDINIKYVSNLHFFIFRFKRKFRFIFSIQEDQTIIHVRDEVESPTGQPLIQQQQQEESKGNYISQKEFEEKYDILQTIGQGSYGSVLQAFDTESDDIVAIKMIQLQEDEDINSVMKEVSMMKNLSTDQQAICHNIINYIDSFIITDNNNLAIVMEYAGAGSIKDLMKGNNRALSEGEAAEVIFQLLNALQFLHQHKIIHRDIKAANVLVTEDGVVKLADFGVSRQLANTLQKRNTVIGTSYHMAPEIFTNSSQGYDDRVDIWSLGITLIEMLQMKPPYSNIHPLRLPTIVSNKPPRLDGQRSPCTGKIFSQQVCSFVASCLQPNPNDRATLDYLQQHEFLKQRHSLQNLINHQFTSSIADADITRASIDITKVIDQAQEELNTVIYQQNNNEDNTILQQQSEQTNQTAIQNTQINIKQFESQDTNETQELQNDQHPKLQATSQQKHKKCCVM